MSENTSDVQVRFDEETSAYLITVDGETAGSAAVQLREDRAVFTHTEIGEAFGGRGLAKVLVSAALADVRERGLPVQAKCSFVAGYLAKNPDAAELAD